MRVASWLPRAGAQGVLKACHRTASALVVVPTCPSSRVRGRKVWGSPWIALPAATAGGGQAAGVGRVARTAAHKGESDDADGHPFKSGRTDDQEDGLLPYEGTALDNGSEDKLDEGGADEKEAVGKLAKKMWRCARLGVRADWVWNKFSVQVLATSGFLNAGDVSRIFIAYARIKYRDLKVIDALSPFLLRHIDSFTTIQLVLLLNAHKKLELQRLDTVQLLLNVICLRRDEWTGWHIALAANALAHFYIYEPKFWKGVGIVLPTHLWTMNALELSLLVSAMARVDRRDARSLLLIARMCRRCGVRGLFCQETLSTAMNAFAKLDFNHPRLSRVFLGATKAKLERALAMGRDYRASMIRGARSSDEDVFDLQSLVRLLHVLVCLDGASDEVIEKILTLVHWSSTEVSDYQRRSIKTAAIVIRKERPSLWSRLSRDVKESIYVIERTPAKVTTYESRWCRELRLTLQKMNIIVELKAVVDDQVLDILLPTSKAVVCPVGPYSYYTNSTHRTAYSKLHQRVLEMSGYKCMVVPYYEWSELRTEEDKMVYLWSMGRRVAAGEATETSSAAPAVVAEDLQTQSDLDDLNDKPQPSAP